MLFVLAITFLGIYYRCNGKGNSLRRKNHGFHFRYIQFETPVKYLHRDTEQVTVYISLYLGKEVRLRLKFSSYQHSNACNAGELGSIPVLGRPLEKEVATHSIILAWRIPWTEEPGRLQSVGSQESDTIEWLSTTTQQHSNEDIIKMCLSPF